VHMFKANLAIAGVHMVIMLDVFLRVDLPICTRWCSMADRLKYRAFSRRKLLCTRTP